jgi:hypothetical protein
MEEAPENGKELSNSAHANGMNEFSHFKFFLKLNNVCCNWEITSLERRKIHMYLDRTSFKNIVDMERQCSSRKPLRI